MFAHKQFCSFAGVALLCSFWAVALPMDVPGTGDSVPVVQSSFVVPFVKMVNGIGSANISAADNARKQALQTLNNMGLETQDRNASVDTFPIGNEVVSYVAIVGIGNPPTQYSLIIDTGSSNTWVGADQPYVQTETTVPTSNSVEIRYGSGYMQGDEYVDEVTLDFITISSQSIGVAKNAVGFNGVDGILGIGPRDLTYGSLFPEILSDIPTVLDNAWQQGLISSYEVGISFDPPTNGSSTNSGKLTFGGVDPDVYVGDINYVPITTEFPASMYVGIDQSISYGNATNNETIMSHRPGIVDTGTTLLLLASDAYDAYQEKTGASLDEDTGLLKISPECFSRLQSLFFTIGNETYELPPEGQRWPPEFNTQIGGQEGIIYLIAANTGTPVGSGLDFINGMTWIEWFYTVYDVGNSRVGFANTRRNTYAHSHRAGMGRVGSANAS